MEEPATLRFDTWKNLETCMEEHPRGIGKLREILVGEPTTARQKDQVRQWMQQGASHRTVWVRSWGRVGAPSYGTFNLDVPLDSG